jgi:Uma2 family endonuclease
MTGGTPNHNKITLNFSSALNFALKSQPYEVFVTDQRLWIPNKKLHTYPDVMIVTPPLEYAPNRRDTLTNPIMIGEILSKSTKNYDKDEKFAAYRTIPTFQEYVLIDQYTLHIEQYTKTEPQKWIFIEYNTPDAILSLTSVPFQIPLLELYNKVDFQFEC